MSEHQMRIVELVQYLVTELVDIPDEAHVQSELKGNNLDITITVNPEETGKIIGRSGRTIKSIRTLARAAAGNSELIVEVDVIG